MLKKIMYDAYSIYSIEGAEGDIEPAKLLDALMNADILEGKGRGSIKVFSLGDRRIACRRFIHGGLLRGLTKDHFFSGERAIRELKIILYLKNAGFPVVEPYCAIVERRGIKKIPYILTLFEEGATNLLDFFSRVEGRSKIVNIKRFAGYMYDLERLGVYHPDLHLNNVLITKDNQMKFLDFDKASVGIVTLRDMERMFWRLNRHVEKMAKKGYSGIIGTREKTLFLRSYERLSGHDMLQVMQKHVKYQGLLDKTGWFLDSLLYR